MATAAQMQLAGLAFITDTVVLIISAVWGAAVWKPLLTWYFSFNYGKQPPLDPGIIWWVPPVYFGMLIAMWFGLLAALIWMSIHQVDYEYGPGY